MKPQDKQNESSQYKSERDFSQGRGVEDWKFTERNILELFTIMKLFYV